MCMCAWKVVCVHVFILHVWSHSRNTGRLWNKQLAHVVLLADHVPTFLCHLKQTTATSWASLLLVLNHRTPAAHSSVWQSSFQVFTPLLSVIRGSPSPFQPGAQLPPKLSFPSKELASTLPTSLLSERSRG